MLKCRIESAKCAVSNGVKALGVHEQSGLCQPAREMIVPSAQRSAHVVAVLRNPVLSKSRPRGLKFAAAVAALLPCGGGHAGESRRGGEAGGDRERCQQRMLLLFIRQHRRRYEGDVMRRLWQTPLVLTNAATN